MSVNGVTGTQAADYYSAYSTTRSSQAANTETAETAASTKESGVVYETSDKTAAKTDNKALIAKLQQDLDTRTQQLESIVTSMLSKQGNASNNYNNIWSLLASGNLSVDQATANRAKEEISEDGYWGVKQTSDRIVDFATALAGDDPEALEKMKGAFEKAYKKAEKIWGGELPEISQQTRDAVLKKFDDLMSPEKQAQVES